MAGNRIGSAARCRADAGKQSSISARARNATEHLRIRRIRTRNIATQGVDRSVSGEGTSRASHTVIVNLSKNAAGGIKRRPALRYHPCSGEPLRRISWKIRRITADLRGRRVGTVRRCNVNWQAVLQLEAIRWVLGNDMRHIDIRHEGQSRITIDDREYLVRRIVGHFVSTIVAAIRRRARFAVPGGNAP